VYPLLDERHDERAGEVLERCFPERELVGLPSREILLGGGNIHCITQQVPRVA
jgi:agmatine deiminase